MDDLSGTFTARALLAKEFQPLPELEARVDAQGRWRAWCPYCRRAHVHSPIPGPRPAHCRSKASPYHPDGYSLRLVGPGEGR